MRFSKKPAEEFSPDWDKIEEGNEEVSRFISNLSSGLPTSKLSVGRWRWVMLGISIGSFPCILTAEYSFSWEVMVTIGRAVSMFAFLLWFLAHYIDLPGTGRFGPYHVESVRKDYILTKAKMDATSRDWSKKDYRFLCAYTDALWEMSQHHPAIVDYQMEYLYHSRLSFLVNLYIHKKETRKENAKNL